MKTTLVRGVCCVGLLLLPQVFAEPPADKIEAGLASGDRDMANQAIAYSVARGTEFLPTLREWAASDDPRLRVRSRTAIGQLTGQWGSQTDLVWGRSFEAAKGKGKPILFLQLFGNLDEEFC